MIAETISASVEPKTPRRNIPSSNELNPQQTRDQLIGNIQLLRFFAALVVTLGHAQAWVELRGLTGATFEQLAPFDFRAGVDVFFVISGFVMYYTSSSHFGAAGYPGHFITRRLIRICPLYWTATLAMLFATLVVPKMIEHRLLSWEQVACSFLFLPFSGPSRDYSFPVVGVGWTLNYEMFFYLCFCLSLTMRRSIGLFLLASGFGIGALLRVLLLRHTYVRFLSEWTDPIIIEFLFGVGLGILFERGSRLPWLVGWLVALFGVGLLIAGQQASILEGRELSRPLILGIPALIICAGLALSDNRDASSRARWTLVWLGNISFALYLTHEFTFNAAWIVLRASRPLNPWLIVAVFCVLSVGISAMVYQFFERSITSQLKLLFSSWRHQRWQIIPQ